MSISLSTYFPADTEYFYSYPSGDSSYFRNNAEPYKEELIAARLLSCQGNAVKSIVFAPTVQSRTWGILQHEAGLPCPSLDKVIMLPKYAVTDLQGPERVAVLSKALKEVATPGKLVMAQPYLDPELAEYYQISPELIRWLNDKKNLPTLVPEQYLPERYAEFPDGKSFVQSTQEYPHPCVIKVSASSSGNGVYLCKTEADIRKAKIALKKMKATICVEEFIFELRNFGVQFGIPYDPNKPIDIIGFNEQMTSEDGTFLGGKIDYPDLYPELSAIYATLKEEILPKVRQLGWYGIGGFDVLVDARGKYYFIDGNFRATGMSAAIFLTKNNLIKTPLISFTGSFKGSEKMLRKHILPHISGGNAEEILTFISLVKKKDTYYFNAALHFTSAMDLYERALYLLTLGVESQLLHDIVQVHVGTPSFVQDGLLVHA